MNSRLLRAARAAMSGDLSLQEPTTRIDETRLGSGARAAASWLVPPVIVPIFLVASVVAYALYRFAHLGAAAFN
jgi:hypothetical protein